MSSNNDYFEEILQNLTPVEEKILLECGKNNITIKKNIIEETIKKKLPNAFLPEFNKSLKNLLAKGLLVKYRPHNYGLSKDGRVISRKIKDNNQKELYSNLRILIFVD
ncbi:hypothetical protein [Methanobrevibacter sp.]|uniref:hypothetical protein n=1 Tax=Methanobrevibacter sp. TaxID=66852 RepID=UPI00386A8345